MVTFSGVSGCGTRIRVKGEQMRKPYSADWGWGLLAGALIGAGCSAMLLLDPRFPPTDAQTRWYIAVGCGVAGGVVIAARNSFWSRSENGQPPDQH
jgi:hypothetical protein